MENDSGPTTMTEATAIHRCIITLTLAFAGSPGPIARAGDTVVAGAARTDAVFNDGFESGSTGAWSSVVP